jgi:RNA polymerase sigma-70 factor (ECF subfamily)
LVVDQRTLVERARQGDRDAFATLVRASATRLDAAARLILRDRELARDAVQEALIRAWRDLRGLRDPDRFDAWLYRLLANAAIEETRRRRRRVIEVAIDSLDVPAHDDVARLFADRDALDRALAELRPEHRALVVLHYYLGVPLPEAAAAMGISLGAAKARLHRSIVALRRAFAGELGEVATTATGGQA